MIASGQAESRASHRGASPLRCCSSHCRTFRLGAVCFSVMPCHVITGQDHARQCPRPMLRSLPVSLESRSWGQCQPDGILGTSARLARVIPTCLKCAGCLDGVCVYHEADPRESEFLDFSYHLTTSEAQRSLTNTLLQQTFTLYKHQLSLSTN